MAQKRKPRPHYFESPKERRYADFPRRYSNEYHFYHNSVNWAAKIGYATLHSAKSHATDGLDLHDFSVVRIFDNKIGQYVATYKRRGRVITPHEGYVK